MVKVLKVEVHPMDKEELRRAKNGWKKARLYFHLKNENVLMDLVGRSFRPKVLFRKVFDEVFEKAGIERPKRITWDQYAGCASCPCSPGFVLDGVFNLNIYVDYEGEAVTEEGKEEYEALKKVAEQVTPPKEEEVVEVSDEASQIKEALEKANGVKTKAAELLGISRSTLSRRMEKYSV